MSDPSVKRHAYTIPAPRELLLDAGMVEPTPDERAELERAAAESREWAAARAERLDAARRRLAELDDPLARAVLDLHAEGGRGECGGCDFDGYEAGRPDWPCRTVEAIAAHYGIDVSGRP